MATIRQLDRLLAKRSIQWILHISVLALSVWLIIMISLDTFRNVTFYFQPSFQRWQFWICVVFMADFIIEWLLADRKWHYLFTHIVFFLVSIPYQWIIVRMGLQLPEKVGYLIRYMPLIRGGYAMAYVVFWFTSNKATGLFLSYIVTMFSTVYFASLTFYLFEHHHNPLVTKYVDALWWACMAVTTEGSNITAMTSVGRVLSVLLAGMGIVMFPVFTVYVTQLIQSKQSEKSSYKERFMEAFHQVVKDSKHSSLSGVESGHVTDASITVGTGKGKNAT